MTTATDKRPSDDPSRYGEEVRVGTAFPHGQYVARRYDPTGIWPWWTSGFEPNAEGDVCVAVTPSFRGITHDLSTYPAQDVTAVQP